MTTRANFVSYGTLGVFVVMVACGCSGQELPSGPSAATSRTAKPEATRAAGTIPVSVLAGLCKLVVPAVNAATKYYVKTDPDLVTIGKLTDKANSLLAGQSDAAINADDITSAYTDYRLSLIQGPEATYAAFMRWHDACTRRGLPLA